MDATNFIIKASPRKDTNLDKAYSNYIKNIQYTLDDDGYQRWEVYNSIMLELVKSGLEDAFTEVKYRLTDKEDPNIVLSDIVSRYEDSNDFFWFIQKKLIEFKEEDVINRFYK